MKWHNKDKEIRRTQWHTAPAPAQSDARAAALWCRQQPSSGLFYNHYTNTRWWFERKKDALHFTLRWLK